jgi:hypothetical protein
MSKRSVVNVSLSDAGLYGVFVGEMLGQFSDGHWENSTMHRCDWQLFHTATTFLTDKTPEELPTIRYNIEEFFASVKRDNIDCIVTRVLMIYNHADMIKKVYETDGKDEADRLVFLLSESDWTEGIKKFRDEDLAKGLTAEKSYYIRRYDLAVKYFGSFENFEKEVPDGKNPENIKKFRRIGTILNKQFKHVRNYYDLKKDYVEI